MTDCEKREIIKSMAMGMAFEQIAMVYNIEISEAEAFYREHKAEVDEERDFQREKWGE